MAARKKPGRKAPRTRVPKSSLIDPGDPIWKGLEKIPLEELLRLVPPRTKPLKKKRGP